MAEFSHPTIKTSINYVEHARKFVHNAISDIENIQSEVMQAWSDFFRGDLQSVLSLEKKYTTNMPTEVKDILSLAYLGIGEAGMLVMDQGNWKDDKNFKTSITEAFRRALVYKPDNEEVLAGWGFMQSIFAEQVTSEEADKLYREADEMFSKAAIISPKNARIYYRWGISLSSWVKSKSNDLVASTEIDHLYERTNEKFNEAARIEPDFAPIYYAWGEMLADRARNKQGNEADKFFELAQEKYAKATQLKFTWDEQVQKLLSELNVQFDDGDVYSSWGNLLFDWALQKDGEEAANLFRRAGEKYQQVVSMRSESFNDLYNWGRALHQQALNQSDEYADGLFKQSVEKHLAAKEIDPADARVYNHLGDTLSAWAQIKSGVEADEKYIQAGKYYSEAISIKPDDAWALINWGQSLFSRAKLNTGAKADELYIQSIDKYERLVKINRSFSTLAHWSIVLDTWARTKDGEEAGELSNRAEMLRAEASELLQNEDLGWLSLLPGTANNTTEGEETV